MPMFRFWASDSRGTDKTADGLHQPSDCAMSRASSPPEFATPIPPKKRRPSFVDTTAFKDAYPPSKRTKTEQDGLLPSPVSASADRTTADALPTPSAAPDVEVAKEAIQFQFGLEILMKHDELRLIDQELAKCQVALEQLRRCHLVPYPVHKGPALASRSGAPVPKWAPPFGVVEGPYARHYAKWLIPDPMFDGVQPGAQATADSGRVKSTAEGRTTRSSISDAVGTGKQRPGRAASGQRLHSLSSGYPQPKDKQSPCVLKRSDGLTVKLVCIDCHRWDFSSTQGFINHCRIAHRRDFKSHDEAAVHCGHPIEIDGNGAIVGDDKKPPVAAAPASGLVHSLARPEPVSEHQAYKSLLSRINTSLDMYKAGKLPSVSSIPGVATRDAQSFVASPDVPYLSQLMQKKKLSGNLKEQVMDAKTKTDWDMFSPGEESDAGSAAPSPAPNATTPDHNKSIATTVRHPVTAMRMPSRTSVSPSHLPSAQRAANKTHTPTSAESSRKPQYAAAAAAAAADDDMDVELTPNTVATSNNAPSLVSDDGEYDDDSDDGSASETSERHEREIEIDDDSDAAAGVGRRVQGRKGEEGEGEEGRRGEEG
ncbi:hypothetical protein N0V88_002730 [Collariella sp. IMI 366227]|nr:hypothetical protein N0V88_002730 [Collariella sp. IMI 366227]